MTTTKFLLATVDGQELRISLAWDARRPFEVHMNTYLGGGVTKPWKFALDLLAAGVLAPSGIGDVRVAPAGDYRTLIVLQVGAERAVLTVATADVEAFLAETWCADPPPITDERIAARIARWSEEMA